MVTRKINGKDTPVKNWGMELRDDEIPRGPQEHDYYSNETYKTVDQDRLVANHPGATQKEYRDFSPTLAPRATGGRPRLTSGPS